MSITINKEDAIFGSVYYFNSEYFKFAIYKYDDDPKTIYLSNVFVNEDNRNQGCGNYILKIADLVAEGFDANTIVLKANKREFVHDWYKRYGYVDYEEDFDDYIWMKKEI